jgi:hypothetical protein
MAIIELLCSFIYALTGTIYFVLKLLIKFTFWICSWIFRILEVPLGYVYRVLWRIGREIARAYECHLYGGNFKKVCTHKQNICRTLKHCFCDEK